MGTSARAIINELKDSDLPAEVILDRQRKKLIEAELAEKEETARLKKKKFGYSFFLYCSIVLCSVFD